MSENVTVVSTTAVSTQYAAATICLRLLRALLACIVFSLVLFALLAGVLVMLAFGAGLGVLLLDRPWQVILRNSALGVLFVVAGIVVLVIMAAIGLLLYKRAAMGSGVLAWSLLSFAALGFIISSLDLALDIEHLVSASEAERGRALLGAAQNLWPIYVAIAFGYGSLGLARISQSRYRNVLADQRLTKGNRAWFDQLIGIPTTFAGQRRRRALLLACLAFLCEGAAFGAYFLGGSAEQPPALSPTAATLIVTIFWPLSVALLYGLLALAKWLWKRARQVGQPSLHEVVSLDPRPPVLFLRSFQDDQVSLESAHVPRYLRAMDPGVVKRRLEELLLTNLSRLGPVIAIGNPTDVRRPIGAGRTYLDRGDWQRHVLTHMEEARAIVVSLSHTQGLGWELDQIRNHGHLGKALFIIPPALSTHLDDIQLRASRAGLQLDVLPDRRQERGPDSRLERHILACWGDAAGAETILCSSQLSELDYEIALRLFVNSSRHVIDAN